MTDVLVQEGVHRLQKPITDPDDASRSRLHRAPKTEAPDDFTTADERLEAFWRKYKEGRICPVTERLERPDGEIEWTVTVTVTTTEPSRQVVASATRATDDPDPIVAAYPHETAQTAATSRALRFIGIKLTKRKGT